MESCSMEAEPQAAVATEVEVMARVVVVRAVAVLTAC